ncbi:uncharacterized protein METZ01_LOCUS312830, partial [marine metagenome]
LDIGHTLVDIMGYFFFSSFMQQQELLVWLDGI